MKKTVRRPVSFHWIRDDETDAVMDIADACFAEVGMDAICGSRMRRWTMGLPLWDQAVLADFLTTKDRIPKVMVVGQSVVGYLFYTLKPKAIVIDQIAVDPDCWRKGYATRMLTRLKRSMPGLRRNIIGLNVAEENLAAQLMLRKNDFHWFRTTTDMLTGRDQYLMRWKQSAS